MTNTTIDLEAVATELDACRQTRSWSPLSTRSRWATELQAILDATSDDERADAVADAEAEAVRLAEVVARSMVDPVWLADRINRLEGVEVDGDTVTEVVAAARTAGVDIDQGEAGERDGLVLTAAVAEVYASMRGWGDDYAGAVVVDLLTGESRVER